MGNTVSIRYEHSLAIVDIDNKEKTLEIIQTTIRSVTWAHIHDTSSKITMGKPYEKIDFDRVSVIRTHTSTGQYWDVSFADQKALKAFSKCISVNMLRAKGDDVPLYGHVKGNLKNPYKPKTKKSVRFDPELSEDPV